MIIIIILLSPSLFPVTDLFKEEDKVIFFIVERNATGDEVLFNVPHVVMILLWHLIRI
jgi:hypothetical protein